MSQQTIMIVDDEHMIVDVIRAYLEKAGFKVVSASSGRDALTVFDRTSPDLIVLDLMLPDIKGEEVCRTIRRKSRVPVIMLTAKATEDDEVTGLGLGADDYITKPFSLRQLMARIQSHLRRQAEEPFPLASQMSFFDGDLVIDSLRHEVRKKGEVVVLTPNEFRLLTTLAKYPTKVFTRDELIDCALGMDFQGSDRTIDSHLKNIRQKIEDDTRHPCYVLTVHGVGYKFGGGNG